MIRSDERGQSETLAVAIIFVLALTSALVIAGIGSVTLEQSKGVAETEKGVQALTELDSKVSLVALEGGDASTIDLSVRGGGRVNVSEAGRIRMIVRNNTTTTVLTNSSLGKVTYTNGKQQVAYQGGGVWRRNVGSNGSVMVSPPEVHYASGTLTLPLIQVTGSERSVSTLRVEKLQTTQVHPNASADMVNPLDKGTELTVFVTSDYYRGWANYFENRIGGNVTIYDSNKTVRVQLVSPASRFKLGAGLISVGTGDRVEMTGSGCCPTFVDSYNSSKGPYSGPSSSRSSNGTVRGEGGVKLSGNSYINGTIDVGGEVRLEGKDTSVRGDVWWSDKLHDPHDGITGANDSNGTGVSIPPITSSVNERVDEICPGSPPLDPDAANTNGTYCVNGALDLSSNDTLTLDLSSGNITIAVTGDIDIDSGQTIEVKNPSGNSVKVWLGGDEIRMSNGTVTVPGDKAPAFRVFGPSDTEVDMSSESKFIGLVFAPGEPGSSGQLKMTSNSSLFGSAVVPAVRLRSGSAVHYDKALGGFSFDRGDTPAAVLSYFYVTVNEVRIEPR